MTEYPFNVAMSVRAYGYVTVSAASAADARAQLTADFVAEKFAPHGGGDDDFGWDCPEDIYCDGICYADDESDCDSEDFAIPNGNWVRKDTVKADTLAALQALLAVVKDALSDDFLDANSDAGAILCGDVAAEAIEAAQAAIAKAKAES